MPGPALRSGAARSWTAGFGSGSDPGPSNVPSGEADGLTGRSPMPDRIVVPVCRSGGRDGTRPPGCTCRIRRVTTQGRALRAAAEGSAGGRRAVCARAADGRAAQVDAADGGAAGRGPSAAAAVHHVLDLGLRGGPAQRGAVVRGPAQPVEALVVDDTGFPKDGDGVAVRGPAVLRDAGQDWRTARSG